MSCFVISNLVVTAGMLTPGLKVLFQIQSFSIMMGQFNMSTLQRAVLIQLAAQYRQRGHSYGR